LGNIGRTTTMFKTDDEQTRFIHAVDNAYAAMHRLRDVTYGDNWDDPLSAAVRDFIVAASVVRNRYRDLA